MFDETSPFLEGFVLNPQKRLVHGTNLLPQTNLCFSRVQQKKLGLYQAARPGSQKATCSFLLLGAPALSGVFDTRVSNVKPVSFVDLPCGLFSRGNHQDALAMWLLSEPF